jgi:hypothetical protein
MRPKDRVTLRKTILKFIVRIILFWPTIGPTLCHLMLRFKQSVGIQIKTQHAHTHTQNEKKELNENLTLLSKQ